MSQRQQSIATAAGRNHVGIEEGLLPYIIVTHSMQQAARAGDLISDKINIFPKRSYSQPMTM